MFIYLRVHMYLATLCNTIHWRHHGQCVYSVATVPW